MAPPASADVLGLTLTPLTEELAQTLGSPGVTDGLVIEAVDANSDAAAKGLAAGDIITEVGQQPVSDIAGFEARIASARDAGQQSVLLLIRRAGNPRFVALSLTAE